MAQKLTLEVPVTATSPTGPSSTYIRLCPDSTASGNWGHSSASLILNSAGYYLLKVGGAAYEERNGSMTTRVKSGGYLYANVSGGFDLETSVDRVEIKSKDNIKFYSDQSQTGVSDLNLDTTIGIRSKEVGNNYLHDIYYYMSYFSQFTEAHRKKEVTGRTYKTIIGYSISMFLSANASAYCALAIGYKTVAMKCTLLKMSVTPLAFGYIGSSNGLMSKSFSFKLIDAKTDILDEEFCVAKYETKIVRFQNDLFKTSNEAWKMNKKTLLDAKYSHMKFGRKMLDCFF